MSNPGQIERVENLDDLSDVHPAIVPGQGLVEPVNYSELLAADPCVHPRAGRGGWLAAWRMRALMYAMKGAVRAVNSGSACRWTRCQGSGRLRIAASMSRCHSVETTSKHHRADAVLPQTSPVLAV